MMTPSRIRSAAGAANYYGKDDYYVTGEAGAPGIEWGGKGAASLGLSGLATTDEFHAVLAGKNPDPEGPALSGASTKEKHHPGWDFTFTVPKSVSLAIVAAERSDPGLAARLQDHVLAANKAMMQYLEENHAVTRVRGEDGTIREVHTGNLVYGSVLHRTTRAGDPHFHVHNPTANTTQNPETGAWGALETRQIYKWQQVASQVGARELQARLMADGFNLERHGELKWELAGADPRLLDEFSTRASEIERASQQLAAERGVQKVTHHQRNMVQKQTRKNKAAHDREALLDGWLARAAKVDGASLEGLLSRAEGGGRDVTPTLKGRMSDTLQRWNAAFRDFLKLNTKPDAFGPSAPRSDPDLEARRLMSFGVKVVEEQSAVNSRHLAYLHALRAAPAGVTFDRIKSAMGRLESDGHVVAADKQDHHGFTTRRTVEVERFIVRAVDAGKGAARPILAPEQVYAALAATAGADRLNADQRNAVAGFLISEDRFRAVPGFAGVGKTFAFDTVRQIAEREGQKVLGLASFNTHAKALQRGAGIKSQTVVSWLQSVERDIAAGGERLAARRASLQKTHLIVDEASTLTNEAGYRLARAVKILQIDSVTIAGDTRQTGGPGAGNVFKAVLDREIQQFPIKTILRQRNAATNLRDGVKDLAEGRLRAGMAKLAPHVHALGPDASDVDLARKAVDLWTESRKAGLESVLITATNRMRALQSALARGELRQEGRLGRQDETRERLSHRHLTRPEQFSAASYELGNILVFNAAFSGRGATQSDRATVVGIDLRNNLLKVQPDRGLPRTVDLTADHGRGYASFSSYALGTHEIAKGERLVWEARFKDRGYERGAEFTVVEKGRKTWTLVHEDGRREKISAKDPALSFTSYAYAMTTERAQGRSIEAPIATLESRAGQAVAETKSYVNWSRLTRIGQMVTDDAPRVLRMLAENDGQKPVALDHIRDLWNAARGAAAKDAMAPVPIKDREVELQKERAFGGGPDGAGERQRTRTPSIEVSRGRSGLNL